MEEKIILKNEAQESNIVLENEGNDTKLFAVYGDNEEQQVNLETEASEELNINIQSETVNEKSINIEQENEAPERIFENDYEKLENKPRINGKELLGDLSTEELGIETSGGADINIIDTFDYLKRFQNNDIYNANAVNISVDWIIQAILDAFNREVLVDINVVVNPQTFQVISNDGSYSDIVNALDLGGIPRIVCQLAGTNIKVFLQLAMIDGTYAYFTTVTKANLGAGEMKYLLGINISERYTKVIVEPLQ